MFKHLIDYYCETLNIYQYGNYEMGYRPPALRGTI